ncbi:MAG: nucleoside triphosphate pyrophosphatase [Arenicellales bacterium]
MSEQRLVLASSSPFRRMLLERLGIPFDVVAPGVDETRRPGERVLEYVRRLALEKAHSVARERPNSLVIGADQAAVHRGAIVGKPSGHDEAVKQLLDASGRKITLYTGLALVNTDTGHVQSDVVPYAVYFRTIDRAAAERYLEKEQPYGCAGSLRAEGLGIALLRKFEGDDPNALIGLPLIRLVEMLQVEGVAVV